MTNLKSEQLDDRCAAAEAALHDCHLCGNHCGIDRTRHAGPCGIGDVAYIANYGPHHGEEAVLRGWRGSGTLFFTGCNLHCQYCQNYDISQEVTGTPADPEKLAAVMLGLQEMGCHNLNLVSPTHVVPHIILGLVLALQTGLTIPVVYNSGGYDAPQALMLMDGLVDIYMPDMKYADVAAGQKYSLVRDYPAVNQAAVREMHRQVGDLQLDENGLARRGLLVRHLVLPGDLAGTAAIAQFLAREISPDTYINIMAQYHPAYKARECAIREGVPLDRRLTPDEYHAAVAAAAEAGLYRFDRR